jgi:hypothetical protein
MASRFNASVYVVKSRLELTSNAASGTGLKISNEWIRLLFIFLILKAIDCFHGAQFAISCLRKKNNEWKIALDLFEAFSDAHLNGDGFVIRNFGEILTLMFTACRGRQGDQMSLRKYRPKRSPAYFSQS